MIKREGQDPLQFTISRKNKQGSNNSNKGSSQAKSKTWQYNNYLHTDSPVQSTQDSDYTDDDYSNDGYDSEGSSDHYSKSSGGESPLGYDDRMSAHDSAHVGTQVQKVVVEQNNNEPFKDQFQMLVDIAVAQLAELERQRGKPTSLPSTPSTSPSSHIANMYS